MGELCYQEENVESYLNAVDRLSTMVVETATETREALQEASEVGMHNTVETALTLIFGMETTVESYAVRHDAAPRHTFLPIVWLPLISGLDRDMCWSPGAIFVSPKVIKGELWREIRCTREAACC
jgi:hypothetical protein